MERDTKTTLNEFILELLLNNVSSRVYNGVFSGVFIGVSSGVFIAIAPNVFIMVSARVLIGVSLIFHPIYQIKDDTYKEILNS